MWCRARKGFRAEEFAVLRRMSDFHIGLPVWGSPHFIGRSVKGDSMAAPSSKSGPGPIEFTLVGVSILAVILLATTILFAKNHGEAAAIADAAKKAEQQANGVISNLQADIDALKKQLGYNQADVGVGDPAPENTVRKNLEKDLTQFGGDSKLTVSAALQQLFTKLEAAQSENAQLKANLEAEKAQFLASTTAQNNRVETFKSDKDKSEADLRKLVSDKDELVRKKDADIAKWQASYRQEQIEKEAIREAAQRQQKDDSEHIAKLNKIVDKLREDLEKIQNISFDVPDGYVTNVDNTNGTVWLSLGKKDGLRPQVTFSVYPRTNKGVARGPEDVKAKIEVVEVRDTSAIARIVEEQRDRPVGIRDEIFSPAWDPGLMEFFAIVGNDDLNNDGFKDQKDRKILKDKLANAGAQIDVEITPDGVREPAEGKLSVRTKWLIVGDVGDPNSVVGDDAEVRRIQEVQKQNNLLLQEAREHGIRVVSMKDFLTYLGWKPESRLYVPGSDAPFTLKAGSRSAGVNDYVGDRSSNAPTSKAVSPK